MSARCSCGWPIPRLVAECVTETSNNIVVEIVIRCPECRVPHEVTLVLEPGSIAIATPYNADGSAGQESTS